MRKVWGGTLLLVDPANRNFKLLSGSSAINNGLTMTDIPAYDLYGNLRQKENAGISEPSNLVERIERFAGAYLLELMCRRTYTRFLDFLEGALSPEGRVYSSQL